jgi:hypothetical protein
MRREHFYYAFIAGGLLLVTIVAVVNYWPSADEPLDPPHVVAERFNTSSAPEEKIRAARDFIRHGENARVEIRAALSQHDALEPEVVAPLLQATGKTRDYRSMPTLLDLLEHPDPEVRGAAGTAVQKILGADFGFRANAPEDERARLIQEMRHDFEVAGPRLQEFYGNQDR